MAGADSELRTSRKKRKLSTRQGVVIGVATVAGVGLMAKLLSFLRREPKPKELDAADLESLEAVLSGDAAKSALPAQKTPKFANLEADDDEPQQPEREEADAASPEAAPETGATTADVESQTKEAPRANGEANGVKDHSEPEDEGTHQPIGDAVEHRTDGNDKEEEAAPRSEDAAESPRDGEVQPIEDAIESQLENRTDLDSEVAAAGDEAIETPTKQGAQDVTPDREDRDAVERQVEDAEKHPTTKEGEKQQDEEEAAGVEEKLSRKDGDVAELPLGDAKELPREEEKTAANGGGDAVVDAEEVSSKESHVVQAAEAETAKEVKANGQEFEPPTAEEKLPEGKLTVEAAKEAPVQADAQTLTAIPDAVEPQTKERLVEDAEKPVTA